MGGPGGARGSHAAVFETHHVRPGPRGDDRCGVRAGVRRHHRHDRQRRHPCGRAPHTAQTGADTVLLVVRGDDDGDGRGDHARPSARAGERTGPSSRPCSWTVRVKSGSS